MTIELEQLTIHNGAPFPFDIAEVDDLAGWEPLPRVIAIDRNGGTFRVMSGGTHEATANALRQIVKDHSEQPLQEWAETEPADDEDDTTG